MTAGTASRYLTGRVATLELERVRYLHHGSGGRLAQHRNHVFRDRADVDIDSPLVGEALGRPRPLGSGSMNTEMAARPSE